MIQSRPNDIRSDEPTPAVPGGEPQDRLRQHADDVRRRAEDAKRAVGDVASQAGESLRSVGRQAKDQVAQTARAATSQVRDRASDVVSTQKDRLAEQVSVFAEALHRAADTLDHHEDQAIGRYVHRAADCVDGCVNYLRERDASEMVRRVGDFTRRHPEVVLGGLFLAGVAAARFLKASDRPARAAFDDRFDRDYGYMDTGRGLESEGRYGYGNPSGAGYADTGYGDIGMYAGGSGELDDIARRDDLETLNEVKGLASWSHEDRGQHGDAGLVPALPAEEPSLVRNADIPSATAPQPGSYPPVTPSGTFFESADESRRTNPSSAADGLSTIGKNDPSINTTKPL